MIYATMCLIVLFTILSIFLSDTLLSVLSLATVSALLGIAFFQLGAPVAGVFELSVGAGLITVLVILTISFIQSKKEKVVSNKTFWALVSLSSAVFLAFLFIIFSSANKSPGVAPVAWNKVGEVLWKTRAFDLIPQVLVILAAAFGILALLRPQKEENE
jgi:NADH-quinone oxidoreductase subunit J